MEDPHRNAFVSVNRRSTLFSDMDKSHWAGQSHTARARDGPGDEKRNALARRRAYDDKLRKRKQQRMHKQRLQRAERARMPSVQQRRRGGQQQQQQPVHGSAPSVPFVSTNRRGSTVSGYGRSQFHVVNAKVRQHGSVPAAGGDQWDPDSKRVARMLGQKVALDGEDIIPAAQDPRSILQRLLAQQREIEAKHALLFAPPQSEDAGVLPVAAEFQA